MFLLDTNVLSDATKLSPHPGVSQWLADKPASMLFISAMTVAEAGYGAERLVPGRKAANLRAWLDEVIVEFGERVLPVDVEVAKAQARIRRAAENARRTMPSIDAFLAATAEVHGLTLVTRNVRDFEAWGGPVLDPWSA